MEGGANSPDMIRNPKTEAARGGLAAADWRLGLRASLPVSPPDGGGGGAKPWSSNLLAIRSTPTPVYGFQHYRELVTEKEVDAWFGVTPDAVKALKRKQEAEIAAKVVELPGAKAA